MKNTLTQLIAATLILLPNLANGQTESLRLQKYWLYRDIFLGDGTVQSPGFIKIGNGPGESIPMSMRNPTWANWRWTFNPEENPGCVQDGLYFHPVINPNTPLITGTVVWSDATMQIGWYLAVLATEWKLLHDQGQPTTATERELYYALRAVDRLDRFGNTLYGQSPTLDGFFARDDVPPDFHQNFPGYGLTLSSATCTTGLVGGCSQGVEGNDSLGLGNTMSNDQVIQLLMGFRCIVEFVDDNVSYSGMNLTDKAKNTTKRIVNYVKKSSPTNGWIIMTPFGDKVCRGPHAYIFSRPMAITAKIITGETGFNNYMSVAVRGHGGFWGYKEAVKALEPGGNEFCILEGKTVTAPNGTVIDLETCFSFSFQDNILMFLTMATISDVFNDEEEIINLSYDKEMEIFALLYYALYGKRPLDESGEKDFWQDLLDSAPCDGTPCFDMPNHNPPIVVPGCQHTPNWMANNRFKKTKHKNTGSPHGYVLGEYRGLDYMLAYNLYRMVFSIEPYVKSKKITGTYPRTIATGGWTPDIVIGNSTFPLRVSAYDTIDVDATILADGDVAIRAGKEINCDEGLDIHPSAKVDCIIEPYSCASTFKTGGGGYPHPVSPAEEEEETKDEEKDLQPPEGFRVYPNPTPGHFTLQLPDYEGSGLSAHVSITDLTGRLIHRRKTTAPQLEIDLSKEAAGMYMVKVQIGYRLFTEKVVKE